jgi:ACS family glucarate transporter-like MFS transporter
MIPKRYLLILGTFLLSMLLYVDRACISAAKDAICGPLEKGGLALSETQMGWVMAAFTLGYALCQTPAGVLADRLGPRRVLTAVVTFWSLFTALTGAAWNYVSMLAARFFFGAGEAGAFPGCARAFYSWLPLSERGLAQGINFSGSRLGAALAFPAIGWMVDGLGWRASFAILGVIGVGWAVFWYVWFRDDPADHPGVSQQERELILRGRQPASGPVDDAPRLSAATLFASRNMWLAMGQYVCSNFTFYFALGWSLPYLKREFGLTTAMAGGYAAVPLLCGALGNWVAGAMVDRIYRQGKWKLSRQIPAIAGFVLAAAGLVGLQLVDSALGYAAMLAVAVFGADMTLSPSWAFCIDIGRRNAGTVSGTMNMAGNLGAFVTLVAFPYLEKWTKAYLDAHPEVPEWVSPTTPYFLGAAALNLLAVGAWLATRPEKPLEEW